MDKNDEVTVVLNKDRIDELLVGNPVWEGNSEYMCDSLLEHLKYTCQGYQELVVRRMLNKIITTKERP